MRTRDNKTVVRRAIIINPKIAFLTQPKRYIGPKSAQKKTLYVFQKPAAKFT